MILFLALAAAAATPPAAKGPLAGRFETCAALAKTDPARQATVLYVTAEVIRQVAILAQPFMPASAAKFLDLLNIPQSARDFAALGEGGRIAPGTKLGEIKPVFPRYVEPEAKAG